MQIRHKIIIAAAGALALCGVLWFRRSIQNNIRNMINGSYFTIDELCQSATAAARGIDNTPSAAVRQNLQSLITNVLDPVRSRYGAPITVSSGYRCEALNKAVGGVANSQHKTGMAADLVGATRSDAELKAIFRAAVAVGGYDQLILEHGANARWVHVSHNAAGAQRGQILYYKNGTYTNIATTWQNYV